jgi:hypothetical protein
MSCLSIQLIVAISKVYGIFHMYAAEACLINMLSPRAFILIYSNTTLNYFAVGVNLSSVEAFTSVFFYRTKKNGTSLKDDNLRIPLKPFRK